MNIVRVRTVLLAGCVSLAAVGAAAAGGLERGGYNIDLLFDPANFATDTSFSYVLPDRTLNDVVDLNPGPGNTNNLNNRKTQGVSDTASYVVPRIGFKVGLGENVDCMVDYSQPWGAHSNPGVNWAGANANVETKINSDNFAANCSYSMDVGPGQARLIGGAFYQRLYGFKDQLISPIPAQLGVGTGVGRLELATDGVGWRIGAAYELPEYAFRVSLVYNSEVKLDSITGVIDLTEVPSFLGTNPLLGVVTPVFGSASMPQTVEMKLQSGIAQDWLALASVKWVDWSVLQIVSFCPTFTAGIPCTAGGPTQAASIDLLYRDGWTVSGGIAHKFNDNWSGTAFVTWDRGTATTVGTTTDTWTLSGGAAYTPSKDFEVRFGGAVGILTAGESIDSNVSYTYDNDFVGALSASARLRF